MARAKKEKEENKKMDLETILPMDKGKFVKMLISAFEKDETLMFFQQGDFLAGEVDGEYRRYDAQSFLFIMSEFMGDSINISTLVKSEYPLIVFRYKFGNNERKVLVAGVIQEDMMGVHCIGLTFVKSEAIDRVLLSQQDNIRLVEHID